MSSNSKSDPKEVFEPDEWVSQVAAAQMRGISRQAIADLVTRGRLRTLVIAGKVLVRKSDVAGFQPKPPGPPPKARPPKRKKKALKK